MQWFDSLPKLNVINHNGATWSELTAIIIHKQKESYNFTTPLVSTATV
ncbi:MAG: hypothetical protein IPF58_18065 [Saprospirales bacterium]|nr:hypothetical protein [Saprospirales bacterium]